MAAFGVGVMGFFLEWDALFSVFLAFVAGTVMFSAALQNGVAMQRETWRMQKQAEADDLADAIAVGLTGPDGNVDLKAVRELALDRTRIAVGSTVFGGNPPADESVFASRRLVRVSGNETVLEVWKW